VQVTDYRRQTVHDRGMVRSYEPFQNFEGSNHVTGTAEPKIVKLCIQVGYIDSSEMMTYHPQTGPGCSHVTVFKILPFAVMQRVTRVR